jgi:predicted nucleotidyltransferase
MIDLTLEQRRSVVEILDRWIPECQVWVFGSRWKQQSRRNSDLDLVIIGSERLSMATLARLRDAFEESDLPFTVDFCDWNRLSPGFQNLISMGHEVLRGA